MIQHPRRLARGRAGPQVQNPSRAVPARIDLGCPRSAFTMVELLVVMVVIGILAGITLGALNAARESARVAKTKTTIAKLDSIIIEKYASYLTRRLPLTNAELRTIAANYTTGRKTFARAKMNAIRDLMRMEMPDRWNDVANADGTIRAPLVSGLTTPALTRRYWNAFDTARNTPGIDRATVELYGPAECLYQIVMGDPEAASLFHDNEIGDSDGDGLREFHDGWGRPIKFIRWPAGFLPLNNADTDLQTNGGVDPFDPQQILSNHYPLFPLVVSAGQDGKDDISFGRKLKDNGSAQAEGDPYLKRTLLPDGDLDPYIVTPIDDTPTAVEVMVGQPIDADPVDGNDNWYDNIHNHRLGGR